MQPTFEASRKVGKQLIKVRLLPTVRKYGEKSGQPFYHEQVDIKKIKKPKKVVGNFLPSDFEVFGLPCEVTFTLDLVQAKTAKDKPLMQITQITFKCPNGLLNSDLPINLLRSLAVQASSFVAEITPANFRREFKNGYEQTDDKGGFMVLSQSSSNKRRAQMFLGIQPTGKDLYEQIGHLYSTLPYGTKYKHIAQAFGRTKAWAYKHTAIGAEQYPQFFKGYKTKTKKAKGKK